VPGGTFNRDNNASYPATVDTFVLDRFEVTVGRFRKFFAQYPGNQPAGGAGKNTNVSSDPGWDPKWNMSTYTYSTAAQLDSAIRNTSTSGAWIDWTLGDDDLPMNCIDWYEAYEFCIWDGGRLPTELEWNYAAAGGSDQRPYPWSTSQTDLTIDSSYAVYDGPPNPAAVYAEVGSCSPKGDGKWGHADLEGNVLEWVEDWQGGYPATCVDCADVPWNDTIVSPNPYRMTRGASAAEWTSPPPNYLLTSTRWYWNLPSYRIDNIGVRCARNP
jgi:formylglycine-generating enzyme required for sulfatase activity